MTSRQSWMLLWTPDPVTMLLLGTICLALVTGTAGAPSRDVVDGSQRDERWLADGSFYDLEYLGDQPQADWRGPISNDLCPPVPKWFPLGGCDVEACSSDRECAQWNLKCCYNGCAYTCLPEVKPAPHFDWFKEPVRRLQFGQSWLVPGPNDVVDVELCSTTPVDDDDSDPLVCPHGYECSIDDPGKPEQSVPNKGHCVKITDDVTASPHYGRGGDDSDLANGQADDPNVNDRASLHACSLGNEQILLSGHSVVIEGKKCLCFEKRLVCDKISSNIED